MISSREAYALNIPESSIKEVMFRRRKSIDQPLGYFTLSECIEFLTNAGLRHDEVISTHNHYVFQQQFCIKEAQFKYVRQQPGIYFVWQKYRYTDISDIHSEYCY